LKNALVFVAVALVVATCGCGDPDAELKQEFRAASLALADRYDTESRRAVEAHDGWMLHPREVHYLTVESAVGDLVPRANGASQSKFSDPVSVIVEFHDQLAQRGIAGLVRPRWLVKELERYEVAGDLGVDGAVDIAHAAGAHLCLDSVPPAQHRIENQ